MAGGRYATYWHRSAGGPIKDRVTFMAPLTEPTRRQQQALKAATTSAVLGKVSMYLTTVEPQTIFLRGHCRSGAQGLISHRRQYGR